MDQSTGDLGVPGQNYTAQQNPQHAGYDQRAGVPIHQQPQAQELTSPFTAQTPTSIIGQQLPPNYKVKAILACIFCFFPTGIAAIIYASKANDSTTMGNIAEGHRTARIARNLTIASVALGLTAYVLTGILAVVFLEYHPH